jgi:hypothetical protein
MAYLGPRVRAKPWVAQLLGCKNSRQVKVKPPDGKISTWQGHEVNKGETMRWQNCEMGEGK